MNEPVDWDKPIELMNGTPAKHVTIGSCREAVEAYAQLWESINGPGSWAENPWVWVVSFQLLAPKPI